MKKILLIFILILGGCQSYWSSDSRIFESQIRNELQLSSYDLINKCQHGALVSETNINFTNGECVLTSNHFYFYVQDPTTQQNRLAHKISLKEIKSFGIIDITPSLKQEPKGQGFSSFPLNSMKCSHYRIVFLSCMQGKSWHRTSEVKSLTSRSG